MHVVKEAITFEPVEEILKRDIQIGREMKLSRSILLSLFPDFRKWVILWERRFLSHCLSPPRTINGYL